MASEKYYDKYWKEGSSGASQEKPPVWDEKNLKRHFLFFKKYIGKNILDAGAGDGTFLNFVLSQFSQGRTLGASQGSALGKAVALEISEEAIRTGRKKYPEMRFEKGSVEEMKFESGTFDTVFAIEILEHLQDVELCLENISRVLKKGGFFCVTTTDFNLLKKIIIALFFWDRYFYPKNPHIRFFTKNTLNSICRRHGLELEDYKWNKSYWGLMPKGQLAVFQKK